MPNKLEITNQILRRERALQTSYSQLESLIDDPQQLTAVRNLRQLQTRQISILRRLIRDLERERPPVPDRRYYVQHILQHGENLRILAIQYNTSVSAIRRVNPGLPEEPQTGQVVNIPIEIPTPPPGSFRHVVRRGDTLFHISRMYGTDIETLVRLNSIEDPDVIFPGRILIIPRD